jgi:hypothetical protein
VVDRQSRLTKIDTAEAILSALRRECSFRDGEKARIGFV